MFFEDVQPPPAFLVVDFRKHSSQSTDIQDVDYQCAFDFPEMEETGMTVSLSIRSDPAPTWTPSQNLHVPFHTSRQDRLFVNTLWVADGHNITSLLLFVPSSTFLSRMSTLEAEDMQYRFSWDEWGPTGTRMRVAPTGHSMVWVCYVFGLSFASPYRNGREVFERPRGPKMIQIFDFNQLAVKKAETEGGEEDPDEDKITIPIITESEVRVTGVFTQPIRTSLPFLWSQKKIPYNPRHTFDAVMLGEDAIVTVTTVCVFRFCLIPVPFSLITTNMQDPDVREYRILSF